jgi:hypothetical protein
LKSSKVKFTLDLWLKALLTLLWLVDTPLMTNELQSTLLAGIDSAVGKEGLTTISEPLKVIRKNLSGMDMA